MKNEYNPSDRHFNCYPGFHQPVHCNYYRTTKKKIINTTLLIFITLGICLDITATVFMILGSSKGGFTIHGFTGYSSLTAMSIDVILIWRRKIKAGVNTEVSRKLYLYSRYAHIWWVLAFVTGGLLLALR